MKLLAWALTKFNKQTLVTVSNNSCKILSSQSTDYLLIFYLSIIRPFLCAEKNSEEHKNFDEQCDSTFHSPNKVVTTLCMCTLTVSFFFAFGT